MLTLYREDKPDYESCIKYIAKNLDSDGIKIDVDTVEDKIDELTPVVNSMKELIEKKYKINNINSSMQIKNKYLSMYDADSDILKACTVYNKGKGGKSYSFSKEVLESLVEKFDDKLASDLLAYREKSQTLKSFVSISDCTNPKGFVHPKVNIGETGRISYSNPALTSINKEFIWDVLAPNEYTNALYVVDISQQEPWILMHWLGIQQLIDLVESDEDKDFYNALSIAALGEKASGDARNEVKRIWNALTYGANGVNLKKYGKIVDSDKIVNYFNTLPEIQEYKNMAWKQVHGSRTDSYEERNVVRTYFEREIHIYDNSKASLLRKILNYRIQGTAADIMVFLVNHISEVLEESGLDDLIKIKYTIYDAIVIEVCGKLQTKEVSEYLKELFSHRIEDWIPFKFKIERVK